MKRQHSIFRAAIGLLSLLITGMSYATPFHVSINTSSLGSAPIGATFDFIDGGSPSNNVAVNGFSTDGALSVSNSIGGVTGGLPSGFTLDDSAFFNEYYQVIIAANSISFDFNTTANIPDIGSSPDTFSFYLLDDQTGLSLFDTTDPTGSNSLFILDINGSNDGLLNVYGLASTATAVTWEVSQGNNTVPEPATLLLLLLGMGSVIYFNHRRQT